MNKETQEYKIKRAIAIKQYRFLLKLIQEAMEKGHYSLVAEWRAECAILKHDFNL